MYLRYYLGIKYAWFRELLRSFGNRTFIKKNESKKVISFITIKGTKRAGVDTLTTILLDDNWVEEL